MPNNLNSLVGGTTACTVDRAAIGQRSTARDRNADPPADVALDDEGTRRAVAGLLLYRNLRSPVLVSGSAIGSAANRRQLRFGITSTVLLALSVGSAFAEMPIAEAKQPLTGVFAKPTLDEQASRKQAIADCEAIWDNKTHMTKQEWSRTCRRVQTRLQLLNVDEPASHPGTRARGR